MEPLSRSGAGFAFGAVGARAQALPEAPAWDVHPTDQDSSLFGASVASAGDVNGDGYGDVLVGAPEWDDEARNQGRAFLYLGSDEGLAPEAAWHADAGGLPGVSNPLVLEHFMRRDLL